MVRRGLLVLVAIVAVLGGAAWFERRPLLRAVADIWIVSDQLAPADAAAVLGGGLNDRPFAAAAYYREGLVKKVVVSNTRAGAAAQLGIVMSDVAANREVLLKLGVQERDIETFGNGPSNTHEEAVALHDWAERTGARSIIVPTEIFAARRVRWMLQREFGDKLGIRVHALDPPEYRRDDWWRNPQAIVAFQNEILKYFYYRLEY